MSGVFAVEDGGSCTVWICPAGDDVVIQIVGFLLLFGNISVPLSSHVCPNQVHECDCIMDHCHPMSRSVTQTTP